MTESSKALLTIGIPTYNREKLLAELLNSIIEVTANWANYNYIEVVISDNNSDDNTSGVSEAFIKNYSGVARYFKNEKNVGITKNLTLLFARSTGKYFTILGDDDRLYKDGLNSLMHLLGSSDDISAVIQGLYEEKTGFISTIDAAKLYFYRFGNAYCGVVDRVAALKQLEDAGYRAEIEDIVWPHTAMSFLAIFELEKVGKQVYIMDKEIGYSPYHDALNIKNYYYYSRTLLDLFKAACIVDKVNNTLSCRSYLYNLKNKFVLSQYYHMLIHVCTEEVKRGEIRRLIREWQQNGGRTGMLLSVIFYPLFSPKLSKALVYCFDFLRGIKPSETSHRFRELSLKKSQGKEGLLSEGQRYGNYWDAD